MKKCTLCSKNKNTTNFYRVGKYLQSRCKECQKALSFKSSLNRRVKPDELILQKDEVFKEFLDNYFISNYSRIYRSEHYYKGRFHCSKFLSKNLLSIGYYKTSIRGKQYLMHRLIAEMFIPNKFNKKQVNHKDSNRSNNIIENLEWVTHQENVSHATKKGRMAVKLKKEEVLEIKNSNKSVKDLAINYGVSKTNIRLILNNKTWKHI